MERINLISVISDVDTYLDLPGNDMGGSFYPILSQWQFDPKTLKLCVDLAKLREDKEGVKLGKTLKKLTPKQLHSIAMSVSQRLPA